MCFLHNIVVVCGTIKVISNVHQNSIRTNEKTSCELFVLCAATKANNAVVS